MPQQDLIQMLRRAKMPVGDEGVSAMEIAKSTGMGLSYVRSELAKLHAEGRLIVGRKTTMDITGRRCSIPAYRVKPDTNRLNRRNESGIPNRNIRGHRAAG